MTSTASRGQVPAHVYPKRKGVMDTLTAGMAVMKKAVEQTTVYRVPSRVFGVQTASGA